MDEDDHVKITEHDLPQIFVLKYLGKSEARGLWGIKNTREPVDKMVNHAKNHQLSLPLIQLKVTKEGVFVASLNFDTEQKRRFMTQDNDMIEKVDENKNVEKIMIKHETENKKVNEKKSKSGSASEFLGNIKQSIFGIKGHLKSNLKNAAEENKQKIGIVVKSTIEICHKRQQNVENGSKLVAKNVAKKEAQKQPLYTDLELLETLKKMEWNKAGMLFYGIDSISYGVTDLIYTRVFSMIVVSDQNDPLFRKSPFTCHAFVCESRGAARKLTYSFAAAFQVYSRSIKTLREQEKKEKHSIEEKPKTYLIDLRATCEITSEKNSSLLGDSEA